MANITADGDLKTVKNKNGLSLSVAGTWGGGAIAFFFSRNENSGWEPLNISVNADGLYEIGITSDVYIKGTLAGATSPNLNYFWV